MNESRRVLAVDDQKATLDFLQSVLPLLEGERFEIRRALSAEEGLLELRRQPYDLVIAGYHLPGMDGLELSRRAKRLRPEMSLILVSDRPASELRDQPSAFGVDHLLLKPLDAEEFLAAVQESLSSSPPASTLESQAYVVEQPAALPSAAIRRLETLCGETGAGQVLLATVTGEILHMTGGQLHRDVPRLIAAASASVSRALALSRQLNEQEPKAVQFVEGSHTDLYWANIGSDYFIAILFDAQVRRGRIGTVWVFTQRAVGELSHLLLTSTAKPELASQPTQEVTPVETQARDDEEPVTSDDNAASPSREEMGPDSAGQLPEDDEVVANDEPAPIESIEAEGAEDQEPERSPKELELDAFWDEALAAESGQDFFSDGISLDEAKSKGLIAEDFDPEEPQSNA